MFKKINLITFLLLAPLTLGCSQLVYSFGKFHLNNATSCQITMNKDGTSKQETVRGVDVSSFYYTSRDENSRTYYSTIHADSRGDVAVGDFHPASQGPTSVVDLGFSPSPGYHAGGAVYVNFTLENWYVYQCIDKTRDGGYCSFGPCLSITSVNPCKTRPSHYYCGYFLKNKLD